MLSVPYDLSFFVSFNNLLSLCALFMYKDIYNMIGNFLQKK